MSVLIEVALWICRAARLLLMTVCVLSCFYTNENKFYGILLKITKPFTVLFSYLIKVVFRKKEVPFALDAFLAYVVMWYITKIFMSLKLSMGFISIP